MTGMPLLDLEFAGTRVFEWLEDNAKRFGYGLSCPPGNRYGYDYEPWRWCYRSSE
jgi:D-alanyl-D-alanine carboxypeptidase